MSNFSKAVEKVLEHEGGFVNHPNDRGGATNWGITQGTYEKFVGHSVTVDEIRNMPKGNAIAIYKQNYWDTVSGDKIKSYPIAFALFDQGVNRGPKRAIQQAQRVLGLTQDGMVGPATLAAINKMDEKQFINKYLEYSETFYRGLASNNPSQAVFLKGWLNRVESLRDYAYANLTTVAGISIVALVGIGAVAYYLSQNPKLKFI